MSLQGVLESVNGFIDRLQKAPLLIACFAFASHDVWRQLESDKRDERKDAMVQAANAEKDRTHELLIKEQTEKLIMKDTIINYAKREMLQLLKDAQK